MEPREAKEYLVRCIAEEAQREGKPLSDVEHDMLYFSETCWTLPNMDSISESFDCHYDQSAYEEKVVALINRFKQRNKTEDAAALITWDEATRTLSSEDHYILVVIGISDSLIRPLSSSETGGSSRMLRLILIAIGIGIVALAFTFTFIFVSMR